MRTSQKFPPELMVELVEYIHKHPGATTEELKAIVLPYFECWYNPETARRQALTRFLDEALKRIGKEKNCRDVLFFRRPDENGKIRHAHAIVATVDKEEILLAQLAAVLLQIEALRRDAHRIMNALGYLRRTGRPNGRVVGRFVLDTITPQSQRRNEA